MNDRLATAAGLLGLVAAAITAGAASSGALIGVEVLAGDASLGEDGALTLEPATLVMVGQGRRLEVTAAVGDGGLDLVRGAPDGPHIIGHVGEIAGLYRQDLVPLGQEPPHPWQAGARGGSDRVALDCRPPLALEANGTPLGMGEPGDGCAPAPLSVGSGAAVRLEEVLVDGQPIQVQREPVDFRVLGAWGLGLLAATPLLGAAGWAPLLAAPLALLGPKLGLPALSVLWVLLGGALIQQATSNRGWRRGLAGLGAAATVAAAALPLLEVEGPGAAAWDADRPAGALIDMRVVERKVEIAAERARPRLAARPADKPLLVALGSSSSGGDLKGRFWPERLQALAPEVHVVSLATGGATSWHMRRLLERLEVSPEICVFYMGHNDRMPGFPGVTIAELERGVEPQSAEWTAPVTLAEARENVAALAARCGRLYVMEEHVIGQRERMEEYAEALQRVDGARYVDGAAALAALPQSTAMIDQVHPSDRGHQALAEVVAGAILEAPLAP